MRKVLFAMPAMLVLGCLMAADTVTISTNTFVRAIERYAEKASPEISSPNAPKVTAGSAVENTTDEEITLTVITNPTILATIEALATSSNQVATCNTLAANLCSWAGQGAPISAKTLMYKSWGGEFCISPCAPGGSVVVFAVRVF